MQGWQPTAIILNQVIIRTFWQFHPNNIPIVENKPLARQMYKSLEVGEEIPSELYNAVVEILAQVFRNRQKKAA